MGCLPAVTPLIYRHPLFHSCRKPETPDAWGTQCGLPALPVVSWKCLFLSVRSQSPLVHVFSSFKVAATALLSLPWWFMSGRKIMSLREELNANVYVQAIISNLKWWLVIYTAESMQYRISCSTVFLTCQLSLLEEWWDVTREHHCLSASLHLDPAPTMIKRTVFLVFVIFFSLRNILFPRHPTKDYGLCTWV